MADISLREYLDKVQILFKTRKFDEVVQHCRQILSHYPRNATATLLLGQALLQTTEAAKAEEVLRRVLAVYPNHALAHASLSDFYNRQGNGDRAIWHMERALEQEPSNKSYADTLRALYQKHRGIENPRFQLTTGAVARQYIRNGLYAQAIDTLRATLSKSPKRVDLRLHLAQTMWDAGMQVDAAETALDVLNTLPYCLEANRILTQLWLAESRPSDAQRYLNQIQEVEPYLALQLAQGTAPDASAFTLAELDYRRVQEAQVASQVPAWLDSIDVDNLEVSDSVLTDADIGHVAVTEPPEVPETRSTASLPPPTTASGHSGLTGRLHPLDFGTEEEEASEEAEALPDWLAEAAPQGTDLESDDLMAVLGEPDENLSLDEIEFETEDAEAPDLFADFDMETEEAEADQAATKPSYSSDDPLAWLEGSGIELNDEAEAALQSAYDDLSEEIQFQDPNELDPLAWLHGSGAEMNTGELQDAAAALEDEEDDDVTDPLTWMHEEDQAEADELSDLMAEFEARDEQAPPDEFAVQPDDLLEWSQEQEEPAGDVPLAASLPEDELADEESSGLAQR